jgi:hypothetical protein
MPNDLAREVIRTWERLNTDRGPWLEHWQECSNYMLPGRSDYIAERTPGMKLMQHVYDGTPIWANDQFAAGMHSMLTSPTLPWFGMKAQEDRLNEIDAVARWLDDTSNAMYSVFNGTKHNFAAQSHEFYLDLGNIGTGIMAVLESPASGILFSTRHLKECVIAENDEDRVDTLTRRWNWTARQAFAKWGPAAGEKVAKAVETNPDQTFTFLHEVKPRRDRNVMRNDRRNKPFRSVYVCLSDTTVIDEGGFDEFPYLAARFSKRSGEVYGRGPGMTALPDVKMLNEMVKTTLKSAQKIVDPPLMVPDDGFLVPVKTVPGSLNYFRPGTRDRIEPIQTHGDPKLGLDMINALRQQITRAFYVDMLLMPTDPADPASAGKGVTATFTLRQRDQHFQQLSPMLARLSSEFLGPLIDRTFAIMWRQSVARRFGPGSPLTPPPPQLAGAALRVEYLSPIAVAQRTSQLDVVARLIQTAQALGTVDQAAPKVLDADAILRLTARDLHAPAIALKSPEQVQAERQAEQQAQAAMMQEQQLGTVAKAAKDGSAAIGNLAGLQQPAAPAQAAA